MVDVGSMRMRKMGGVACSIHCVYHAYQAMAEDSERAKIFDSSSWLTIAVMPVGNAAKMVKLASRLMSTYLVLGYAHEHSRKRTWVESIGVANKTQHLRCS